ncbi:MAG: DNA-protecting protein DprA [Alphaproteobacteria bacterium]|nr:DNA-protecting protein DprA [Alphaproteobacteria bacterium]
MSFAERVNWLRLTRTDGIGPVTFRRLIARYGDAALALDRVREFTNSARRIRVPTRADAEAELDAADRVGARAIALCEEDYPSLLREIPDAPPMLFVVGDANLFARRSIAIVGARNASLAGRKMAATLAADLGAAGVAIVSGLARGIDGAAHEASLATGAIAAVAGGVDVIYPPEHGELMRNIAERGAIVSERAPGAQPTARDFPRRNRLISGLSLGVIVVEAAARSGTLITARCALEQGRDVFAVPGSPIDPRAAGANRLLQQGAGLITCATDVLEAIATPLGRNGGLARFQFDEDALGGNADVHQTADDDPRRREIRNVVLDLLGPTPAYRDDILRAVDEPASLVLDALVELTLAGDIDEREGGAFVRVNF